MINNRYFIMAVQLVLVIAGLLITQIHLYFILVAAFLLVVSHILLRKSTGDSKQYYRHIRQTSIFMVVLMLGILPLALIAIFFDYQVNSLLPSFSLIRENPEAFIQASVVMFNMFGLLCLGVVSLLAFRSYKLLLAVIKKDTKIIKEAKFLKGKSKISI